MEQLLYRTKRIHISLPAILVKRIPRVNFVMPEKFKGTIVERTAIFWKNLYLDYESTFTDLLKAAKAKPRKATFYVTGLGFLVYCAKLTPDEQSYREELLANIEEIVLLPPSMRNPVPVKEFQFIENCYNESRIHWFSFGFFSVIWFSDYDNSGTYDAQCTYLQPKLISFPSRVIDVGFFGKWWRIMYLMEDFDINPEEIINP